jgi:hypothetical protein
MLSTRRTRGNRVRASTRVEPIDGYRRATPEAKVSQNARPFRSTRVTDVPVQGARDGEQRHVGPPRLTRQICRSACPAFCRQVRARDVRSDRANLARAHSPKHNQRTRRRNR